MTKHKYFPHFCILLAGSLWGCIGIFNRTISACGISAQTIVFFRNTGACLLLGVMFLLFDRSVFRIRPRHLPIFLCTGVVSILFFTICYFKSQQVSPLSTAAILLYTAPTFVVVLSALVIAFLGCCFVAGILSGSLSLSRQGLLLGVGSGFFYATYSIFGRFALAHYQPFTVTFYTFLVAGLGSLFVVRPAEVSLVLHTPKALLMALGLMLFATVLPYLFYTKGLNDLGDGGKASILASIEPVVASLVGVLVFGEPMTAGVILGLVCILISVYILR